MIKLKQKVSGCLRTLTGARQFCAIRSYLSTAAKHGICFFDALIMLTEGRPWMPAPARSSPVIPGTWPVTRQEGTLLRQSRILRLAKTTKAKPSTAATFVPLSGGLPSAAQNTTLNRTIAASASQMRSGKRHSRGLLSFHLSFLLRDEGEVLAIVTVNPPTATQAQSLVPTASPLPWPTRDRRPGLLERHRRHKEGPFCCHNRAGNAHLDTVPALSHERPDQRWTTGDTRALIGRIGRRRGEVQSYYGP